MHVGSRKPMKLTRSIVDSHCPPYPTPRINKSVNCCWGGGFAGELPASRAESRNAIFMSHYHFEVCPFQDAGTYEILTFLNVTPINSLVHQLHLGRKIFLVCHQSPTWGDQLFVFMSPQKKDTAVIKVYVRASYTAARQLIQDLIIQGIQCMRIIQG